MVRILGLDPGSRVTGFGVVDAGQAGLRYVASGCIRVGNGAMPERLLEIHRHVTELVDTYAPGEIAIERVFMHKNPDSALKLGQARGAALCGACHAGAPVYEYAPRAIKQTVTGTGAAAKGPFSFHGITLNRPTTILKHVIQTICYGIMATNNVIWSCDVSSFQIKPN